MNRFKSLAFSAPEDMIFGIAPNPVECGYGVTIGNGMVLPEVNFTLPAMQVSEANVRDILKQYREMVEGILSRCVLLNVPGVVIEFEHAPQMTDFSAIGVLVSEQTKEIMHEYQLRDGLKSALRVTVCDIREKDRPPRMRTGDATRRVIDAFSLNANKGADLLSIESTGGKEVCDRAVMEADMSGILLALGILAPRDMHFLWSKIKEIAQEKKVIAAGDTACAFANTAMVLADQRYIPGVLAAIIRAMSAVRSLVAFEEGAIGPSKDCAYEGPVLKAITGVPISMEGKASACAHFSHVGNIASAVCDLWSNESVQNVKLLSGFAPEVFSEILAYDCRLMNKALEDGDENVLQKLMIESDIYRNVQALIISPASSYRIAKTIIAEDSDFDRTRAAGLMGCEIIREGLETELRLSDREIQYLDRIQYELERLTSEEIVMESALPNYHDVFIASEYGL